MTPTREEEERIIHSCIRHYFLRFEDTQAVDFISFLYGQLTELTSLPSFVIDRVSFEVK